jgi:hypothetical protein
MEVALYIVWRIRMSESCAFAESGEEGVLICRKCNREIKTKMSKDKVRRRCSINKPPGLVQKGLHFGKALVNHVADGAIKVTDEQWQARMNACGDCEHKYGNSCSICGCGLSGKARWRSEDCPINKWPKL